MRRLIVFMAGVAFGTAVVVAADIFEMWTAMLGDDLEF